jgi:hypothetical protein
MSRIQGNSARHRYKNMSTDKRLRASLDVTLAAVMMVIVYRVALHVGGWQDFLSESAPAMRRLTHGDLQGFLTLVPAYGGSLILQAPAAVVGGMLGGISDIYRVSALFCLAVMATFSLIVAKRAHMGGHSTLTGMVLVALLVANPIAIWAIKEGHPEEVLTTALSVGAMLLLMNGRISVAALLLGLALGCDYRR